MLRTVLKQMIFGWRKPEARARPPIADDYDLRDRAPDVALADLIASCAKLVTDRMAPDIQARMLTLADSFTSAPRPAGSSLNVFVYHADMGSASRLQYRDLAFDTGRFDYRAVLEAFLASVVRWHPEAHVYLATNRGSPLAALDNERLQVVMLDVDTAAPMYERVNAMCAYVHSGAFDADTLFLDSDAFLNASFAPYLDADYDVAVTVRETPGLMPVNEGVMVARAARPEAVHLFFRRYLATYEALCAHAPVQSYYGDIRKWRGGQLTLNAITRDAAPFSHYRHTSLSGLILKVLPCDPFNYSYEYGEEAQLSNLHDKVIVHLKGGRKASLDAWLAHARGTEPRPAGSAGPTIEPLFALWNKEYQKTPFSIGHMRETFASNVQTAGEMVSANKPGSGAFLGDDLFVWFRNVAFLSDPSFVQAMGPLRDDPTLRARIWRVYMLCWAARSCMALEGDFLDAGCYDGKTVEVIERYCGFRSRHDKCYWLYDMFENPPAESRKSGHGPMLYDHVRRQFEPLGNFRVIKGPVPESFEQGLPARIAFAQIDLNAAQPELACLQAIYDLIVPGGIVVFDDFGFRRYRESHDKETAYLASKGQFVWESPTGQGLFIKR